MPNLNEDCRIDPRVKAVFGAFPMNENPGDIDSREQLIAEANSEQAQNATAAIVTMLETCDTEQYAPQENIRLEMTSCVSQPDGNTINLQIVRPDNDEVLPCINYIHGGGMQSMSCTYGNYRAWEKIIASMGHCVVMEDFRNALTPSSVPEVEPFPAGLNDCVSGLRNLPDFAKRYHFDATNVTIAGESGGGNLTLATALKLAKDGDIHRVKDCSRYVHILQVVGRCQKTFVYGEQRLDV